MSKLISVIIPVYKVEKYLNRCVESLLNQTYKNLEIILVDDGSPDNCPQMCDEWAKKDVRIKVIHKRNGGVSSARNCGIQNADGDYLAFVDSDDYVTENFSKCLEKLSNQDIVIVPFYNNQPSDKHVERSRVKVGDWCGKNPSDFSQNSIWTKIIRKDLIKNNNISVDCSLKIAEDFKFCMQAIAKADKIEYVDIPYYVYFVNSGSVMSNITYSKICDTMTSCEYVAEMMPEIKNKVKLRYIKKLLSDNLLSVAFRCGAYETEQNAQLIRRLKKVKKYIRYGSTFKKKLATLFINFFGVKLFSKISRMILSKRS